MKVNKKYKDRLFRHLFNNKRTQLELYNAIYGTDYQNESIIDSNTLIEAIFASPENDLAFSINKKIIIFIEHQSTINKNMPARFLTYIARYYEKKIGKKIYGESLVKIPKPEFIVLYNGEKPFPKEKILRFSDAFEKIDNDNLISLDLIVRVININKGCNPELMRRCKTLADYAAFIAKVREYKKKYPREKWEEAIKSAIRYCIKNDILADYLIQNSSEVIRMLINEYTMKDAIEVIREETMEKGLKKGRAEGKKYVLELMAQGLSYEEIKKKIENYYPVKEMSKKNTYGKN